MRRLLGVADVKLNVIGALEREKILLPAADDLSSEQLRVLFP